MSGIHGRASFKPRTGELVLVRDDKRSLLRSLIADGLSGRRR